MEIRRAGPADAAAIASVHVRTWQAAYAHVFGAERLAGLELERRSAAWARVLGEPREGEATLVAEGPDGEVVGFASTGPSHDGGAAGELYAIYVLPEAWGGGAGPELMREALAALRADGFREATLWVLEDNPRARRFYEREGWRLDPGALREGEHLGVATAEVRYRRSL